MTFDSYRAERLPDLPRTRNQTRWEKETSDAIMMFMRGAERHRPLLLSIVVQGRAKWRETAGRVWRGLLINDEILDSIYFYFVMQAGPNPAAQLATLLELHLDGHHGSGD